MAPTNARAKAMIIPRLRSRKTLRDALSHCPHGHLHNFQASYGATNAATAGLVYEICYARPGATRCSRHRKPLPANVQMDEQIRQALLLEITQLDPPPTVVQNGTPTHSTPTASSLSASPSTFGTSSPSTLMTTSDEFVTADDASPDRPSTSPHFPCRISELCPPPNPTRKKHSLVRHPPRIDLSLAPTLHSRSDQRNLALPSTPTGKGNLVRTRGKAAAQQKYPRVPTPSTINGSSFIDIHSGDVPTDIDSSPSVRTTLSTIQDFSIIDIHSGDVPTDIDSSPATQASSRKPIDARNLRSSRRPPALRLPIRSRTPQGPAIDIVSTDDEDSVPSVQRTRGSPELGLSRPIGVDKGKARGGLVVGLPRSAKRSAISDDEDITGAVETNKGKVVARKKIRIARMTTGKRPTASKNVERCAGPSKLPVTDDVIDITSGDDD